MGSIRTWWNQGNKPPYVEENPGSWYRQRLGEVWVQLLWGVKGPCMVCLLCNPSLHYFYFGGMGGPWVQLLRGLGACVCVILVLHECIWNELTVSLILSVFDNTSYLGYSPYWVVYHLGSTLGNYLLFLCRE